MASQLIFTENASSPDTPTSGKLKLYAKTDGFLYFRNDAGTETLISGSAGITALTGDVSATGPGSVPATVNLVGGQTAANVAAATILANAATNANTPNAIVRRDASGNFSAGTITANLSGNATNFTGSLSGDVTGTQSATVISAATVTGKLLTGFVSGAGTVSAADSILTAINKLDGNDGLRVLKAGDTMTGILVMDNQQAIRFREDSSNGTEFVGIRAPASLAASYTLQLPLAQASLAGQALVNDGSGNLSWASASLSGFTTDDLPEGVTNLYFTDERAQDAVGNILTDTSKIDFTYNDGAPSISATIVPLSIDNGDISTSAAIAYSKLALSNSIVNADINTSAAIAYSKLNLTGSIVNADMNAAAAIAYSKLNLSNSIVNADVNPSAAIAYSKLNLLASIVDADIAGAAAISLTKLAVLTANRAVVTNGSGVLSVSAVTSTEVGYLAGVTSAIQTQLNGKQATGNYITNLTGDVVANGPGSVTATIQPGVIDNAKVSATAAIAYSKLNLSNSIVNADINASAAIVYSKLSLANSIVNADINTAAAIAYSKLNLTGSIVNADVNASAAIVYSKLSLTNSIVNADINASAAIAYSKLNLTGSIVNADVNAAAAIAGTKISPDWGSQNTTTTGTSTASRFLATGTGGNGYVEIPNQSSAPGTPTSAGRIYFDNSNRLSWKGTNGFVRTFDGTANTADRIYTLPDSAGTIKLQITSQSISTNTALTDSLADLILYISTAAARTITLPNPANNTNRRIIFKDVTGTMETNNVTIARFGSEKIENLAASKVIAANYGAYTLISDGTDWWSL